MCKKLIKTLSAGLSKPVNWKPANKLFLKSRSNEEFSKKI